MPKCDFNKFQSNFIEITLQHGCSPVDLLHIFRTRFPRGGLPSSKACNIFILLWSNSENEGKKSIFSNLYNWDYTCIMYLKISQC